jgi:hypothetical protein
MIKHYCKLQTTIENISKYFDIITLLINQGLQCVY